MTRAKWTTGAALVAAALLAAAAEPQRWGNAVYASGGVGAESRDELARAVPDANLRVVTAAKGSGAFLAGVDLEVVDDRGVVALRTTLEGPILVARLPSGRYQLRADFRGVRQTRMVQAPAAGTRVEHFYWDDPSVVPFPGSGPSPRS